MPAKQATQPDTEKVMNSRGGNLVVRVSGSLRKSILDGEYKPGDKLPSEARLTELHSVSRTVVREAIAALRSDGLVEPRRGAGVFVLEPLAVPDLPFQNIDPARVSSIIEILELRTAVEVEGAGLAALRRSPAQEGTIIDRHRAVRRCMDGAESTSLADFELHVAIAEATNNPRFAEFLELMGQSIIPRAALRTLESDHASPGYLVQINDEHEKIVSAISYQDADGARAAMREHLHRSQRRYRDLIRDIKM